MILLISSSFTFPTYFLAPSVWAVLGWGSQQMYVPGTVKIHYNLCSPDISILQTS